MTGHVQPTGSYCCTTVMGKFDSHIEGKVYPAGVTPKCDQFSIRLNIVVDKWAGMTKSASTGSCTQ